ncbi:unnamed protein product [Brachionus calyciflorus]|uniref:Uncharacterized protein n=1 Tax=Brachionus calyciflorus TaxID=104777 RepID=A0A814NBR9_9BILA|nr:unnamed protein product [Brachionus calyciflorus]
MLSHLTKNSKNFKLDSHDRKKSLTNEKNVVYLKIEPDEALNLSKNNYNDFSQIESINNCALSSSFNIVDFANDFKTQNENMFDQEMVSNNSKYSICSQISDLIYTDTIENKLSNECPECKRKLQMDYKLNKEDQLKRIFTNKRKDLINFTPKISDTLFKIL